MNEKTVEKEIDLQKLFLAYLKKWWLIVAATVVAAMVFLGVTYYFITPQYKATTTIYINNSKEGTDIDSVSTGALSASQQLVTTCIRIVKSDRVMDKVAEQLNQEYSTDRLKSMTSAEQIAKTEIFALSITGPERDETIRIANVMADVVPNEIADLIEGSSARVLDYARTSSKASPNYSKNTLLGAVMGCFLSVAYITLLFLLDVRIKDEEDLTALVDLPVLGRIPDFSAMEKAPHYGYRRVRSGKSSADKA